MPRSERPRVFLSPPEAKDIAAFLERQASEPFSYRELGASSHGAPAGYNVDHNRVRVGRGLATFEAACEALRAWRMFPAPWTRIAPANAPLNEGQTVAMQAQALGVWWLNACRVVYVVDEVGPVRRFGFAYGTLRAHVEQGEERFLVEMQPDESVWYDLRAFSRPRYWPVRLGKPLARKLQWRFVRESLAAMQRAVAEGRRT